MPSTSSFPEDSPKIFASNHEDIHVSSNGPTNTSGLAVECRLTTIYRTFSHAQSVLIYRTQQKSRPRASGGLNVFPKSGALGRQKIILCLAVYIIFPSLGRWHLSRLLKRETKAMKWRMSGHPIARPVPIQRHTFRPSGSSPLCHLQE